MNLNYLRVFFAVAKAQSFSKAAEELHVSQPTISVQVKNLETEFEIKLFEQIGKKIYLTDAGKTLYGYAKKVFYLIDEAEGAIREFKGLTKGRLVIGSSTTPGIYILPKILGMFKKTFPGIETIIEIGNAEEIEQKLISNVIELAMVSGHGFANPSLEVKPVTHDNLVIVVSEEHRLADRGIATLDEIINETFILREPGSSTRIALENRLKELEKNINISMQFGSLEAIKQAVAANLGVSILSQFVIDQEVCTGRLHVIRVPELEIKSEVNIIYHKDKNLSAPTMAFLRLLKENIGPKCSTL